MQKILTLETNKYAIKIENFEGPLDLLCHLIDKNKMNIYEINLVRNNRSVYRIYKCYGKNESRGNKRIYTNGIYSSISKI